MTKYKCYSNEKKTNITSTAPTNYHSKKVRLKLFFAYSFISDHITINNYDYLLLLCETKRYNRKWKIMNFKKLLLEILRVIIFIT